METFLNAAWLVIAVVFTVVWYFRWLPVIRYRIRRDSGGLSLYALIVFLLLLFPVISLTDDLHEDFLALMAESEVSRAVLQVGGSGHHSQISHGAPHAADGLACGDWNAAPSVLLEVLVPLRIAPPDSIFRRSVNNRAPPANS